MLLQRWQQRNTFLLTTMHNSLLLKKKDSPNYKDLEKLKNGIFNQSIKQGIIFFLCRYFAEIMALNVFATSIESIMAVLGHDYLTGYLSTSTWSAIAILSLWSSVALLGYHKIRTLPIQTVILIPIYILLFVVIIPVTYQSFLIPMFFTSMLLKRVKLNYGRG
ncbi:uncharacterized protein LOC111124318 [Crassostrea virginica]